MEILLIVFGAIMFVLWSMLLLICGYFAGLHSEEKNK